MPTSIAEAHTSQVLRERSAIFAKDRGNSEKAWSLPGKRFTGAARRHQTLDPPPFGARLAMSSRLRIPGSLAVGLLLLNALAPTTGCAESDVAEDAADSDNALSQPAGGLPVGVPQVMALGERVGRALVFKKPDGSTYSRAAAGYNQAPLSLDGDKWGPTLGAADPQQFAGWATSQGKEWKCVDAEKFATDGNKLTNANQMCRVEINPTGDQGFSVTLIGLDSAGKGISKYSSPEAPPSPHP